MRNQRFFAGILFTLLMAGTFFTPGRVNGQGKSSVAVIAINSIKMPYENQQTTDVTRNALEKLNLYYVIDKYDQMALAESNALNLDNCFARQCIVESGKMLNADYVLTGSIENFSRKIIVKYRLINTLTSDIEKFRIIEFLDLKDQLPAMVELTLRNLFEQPFDQDLFTKLTQENAFENTINTPEIEALDLSGPRMGLTVLTGVIGEVFSKPKSEGGYNALPVITQFGYQFEIKYLNEGNFQALFEIIPIISGLDQGLFIPSISVLNGLRSNKNGWEIGFGPQLIMSRKASGYLVDGDFILDTDISGPIEGSLVERVDSRGDIFVSTGFVFALGKTFKSGSLNMPVNIFYKPAKNAHQFGISFGFNTGRMRRN